MLETSCTCHLRATDEPALMFELRVAAHAMGEGELAHATHHVAGALGLAPTDGRTLEAVEALLARKDRTEVPERGWFGEFALAAHALHRAGDEMRAIDILSQVADTMPHLGYEHTLTAWVSALAEPLDEGAALRIGRLLAGICGSTVGLHRLRPGERALLESYGALAAAVAATGATGGDAAFAAGTLRRVGRYEEALAAAARAEGENGPMQRGLTHRAIGDGRAALAAFERAEALAGADFSHERARCLYVAGEFEAARGLVATDADDAELRGLRRLCEVRPTGDRVDHLDQLWRAARRPWSDRPSDATANMFDGRRQTGLSVAVRGWESPTNRLLLAINEGHTDVTRVSYVIDFEDFPRPALAQTRGHAPLWVPTAEGPVQGVPAPPADMTATLGQIASDHREPDALWDACARFVEVQAPETRALFGAMVHPPAATLGEDLPGDVFRYQVACAFALAALPTERALAALESVVFGPVDWASAAGTIALGELARRDAAPAIRARGLLLAVPDDLLPAGTEPRLLPLYQALELLPGTPASALEKLRAHYREYVAEEEDEAEE